MSRPIPADSLSHSFFGVPWALGMVVLRGIFLIRTCQGAVTARKPGRFVIQCVPVRLDPLAGDEFVTKMPPNGPKRRQNPALATGLHIKKPV
jgi:hypothetical protein